MGETVGQAGKSNRVPDLRAELWLERRLSQHGVRLHEGLSDVASRKAKARHAIQTHGLAMIIAGRGKDGVPRDYRAAFERIYGEPLEITHENGDGV